jgi:class I fructose-bisphosphate aldolase
MYASKVMGLLGLESDYYLKHTCKTMDKSLVRLPSPEFVDTVWVHSDRSIQTLRSLRLLFAHGRLAGTGYLSVLSADQGVEHTAADSFTSNPLYFDPENVVRLAIEGGCNAVAAPFGLLGIVARRYAHKIPFIVKINHNEQLSYPNSYAQVLFGSVKEAWNMGAAAVGATVYFGLPEGRRRLAEVAEAFEYAHELGMATMLWCDLRNDNFKINDADYHASADLTGQANHLAATMRADFIKQRLPLNNGGFPALNFSAYNPAMYTALATEHPIDLCRYQVVNGYMGRIGLISSDDDPSQREASGMKEALLAAVVNKRAGGMGLISGRSAFQKPMKNGVELLHAVQDVYLDSEITIA